MRRIGPMGSAGGRMTRRRWPELNRSSQRGVPVTLRVGRDDGACPGDAAVVAEARAERVPERAGEYEFTCGMGMLRGKVLVR